MDDRLLDAFFAQYRLKYQPIRSLRSGAEGPVVLVKETATGVDVVVKLITEEATLDGERRFRIPRLSTAPQYVDLITVEPLLIDGHVYHAVVTRYIDGVEWGAFIEALGTALADASVTERRVDELLLTGLMRLVEAVRAMHRERIGHGALSERNVLVRDVGTDSREPDVVLIDLASEHTAQNENEFIATDVYFLRKLAMRSAERLSPDLREVTQACLAECVRPDHMAALFQACLQRSSLMEAADSSPVFHAQVARHLVGTGLSGLFGAAPWATVYATDTLRVFAIDRHDERFIAAVKEAVGGVSARGSATVRNVAEERALSRVLTPPAAEQPNKQPAS